jgi:hypothetical protein
MQKVKAGLVKEQRNDEAGQSPGTVNLYVLWSFHINAALTKNGPADSEPCEVPLPCFVASVVNW